MDEQQKPILDYASPAQAAPSWRDWRTAPIGFPSVFVAVLASFVFIATQGDLAVARIVAATGVAVALAGIRFDRCKPMACMGLVYNAIVLFLTVFV